MITESVRTYLRDTKISDPNGRLISLAQAFIDVLKYNNDVCRKRSLVRAQAQARYLQARNKQLKSTIEGVAAATASDNIDSRYDAVLATAQTRYDEDPELMRYCLGIGGSISSYIGRDAFAKQDVILNEARISVLQQLLVEAAASTKRYEEIIADLEAIK